MDGKPMIEQVMNEEVFWEKVTPEGVEYTATVKGRACKLRMNDFPEEPLYTLTVGDEQVDLDDAPKSWHFPWNQS
jgi:hypothetical protein